MVEQCRVTLDLIQYPLRITIKILIMSENWYLMIILGTLIVIIWITSTSSWGCSVDSSPGAQSFLLFNIFNFVWICFKISSIWISHFFRFSRNLDIRDLFENLMKSLREPHISVELKIADERRSLQRRLLSILSVILSDYYFTI